MRLHALLHANNVTLLTASSIRSRQSRRRRPASCTSDPEIHTSTQSRQRHRPSTLRQSKRGPSVQIWIQVALAETKATRADRRDTHYQLGEYQSRILSQGTPWECETVSNEGSWSVGNAFHTVVTAMCCGNGTTETAFPSLSGRCNGGLTSCRPPYRGHRKRSGKFTTRFPCLSSYCTPSVYTPLAPDATLPTI